MEEHILGKTWSSFMQYFLWGKHFASLVLATWLNGGQDGEIIWLQLQNKHPGEAAVHHQLGMRNQ